MAQLCCYASRRIPSLLRSEVRARENPYKNGAFFGWLVAGKIPVKSDKLELIEGKTLNLTFLVIYIPPVPIENWLPLTHNRSRKLLK